jgi:hypothetical protein
MTILASQVRQLAMLLGPESEKGLKIIFPRAYAWEKLDPKCLNLTPYPFVKNEAGVDITDLILPYAPGDYGREVHVGVWRPGQGDQEFKVEGYVYKVMENLHDGTFSVWRCAE